MRRNLDIFSHIDLGKKTTTERIIEAVNGRRASDCSAVWYSLADWGDYDIFNGRRDNITHDKHHSKEAAEGVCRRLQKDGFGGDGQVFPVKVWASQTIPDAPKTYLEEISEQNDH